MQLSQMLNYLMNVRGVSAYKISKDTGISDRLIGYWRNGEKLPGAENLLTIANYFDISVDYLLTGKEKSSSLSEDELELLSYYKKLPDKEKIKLVSRAEAIADMCSEAAPEPAPPMLVIKHSMYKVSAGTGEQLSDYDDWDKIEVPDTPEARRADFCLTIYGNSMEPVYYDGDIVLVKQQSEIERGQIGIFIIEGCGYIKKFGGDRLISLNAEYDDIMFADYNSDDIRCSGLVIGRV